jgi:hypothetical protein
MNDGLDGNIFTEIDASTIRNKPEYTLHSSTAPNLIGSTYMFKLEAYNINGSTFSEPISFVFADKPTAPSNAPISDLSVTTTNKIKINYLVQALDGGSPVLSYSLEIDDGKGGDI